MTPRPVRRRFGRVARELEAALVQIAHMGATASQARGGQGQALAADMGRVATMALARARGEERSGQA